MPASSQPSFQRQNHLLDTYRPTKTILNSDDNTRSGRVHDRSGFWSDQHSSGSSHPDAHSSSQPLRLGLHHLSPGKIKPPMGRLLPALSRYHYQLHGPVGLLAH